MNMPRFTAEASLNSAGRRYRSLATRASRDGVVPAFPWDPPQIGVSYQPPRPPFGEGFPGTLKITGQNFAADAAVVVSAGNCSEGGVAVMAEAHTSKSSSYCPNPLHCYYQFGGQFSVTVPCYCGGDSTATARDAAGNVATGTVGLPC
jgi:hypothetical protein